MASLNITLAKFATDFLDGLTAKNRNSFRYQATNAHDE
jgi:hypothetical protein